MSKLPKSARIGAVLVIGGVLAGCSPAAVATPSVAAPESASPTAAPASPSASASASAQAVASATPRPGQVPPGPSKIFDDEGVATMTVMIPATGSGWTNDGLGLWKDYGPTGQQPGPVIHVWPGGITGTFKDPCTDHTPIIPEPEGVEALIAALGDQPGISSGPATDVTISGFKGQYVETKVTQDITKCGNGEDGFWLWNSSKTDRRYVQDTGEINRMYAMDVDGKIHTFSVRLPPTTTGEDLAEVESMLTTIEITPGVTSSPAP